MPCCRRKQLRYRFEQCAKIPPTSPTKTKGAPGKQADDEREAFVCGVVPQEVNDKEYYLSCGTTYSVKARNPKMNSHSLLLFVVLP